MNTVCMLNDQNQPKHADSILSGGFNHNHVFLSKDGTWMLRREAHCNGSDTIDRIRHEFNKYGWLAHGNTVRRRTINEQAELHSRASELGLHVPSPVREDRGTMLIPYVSDAVPIDRYLQAASPYEANRIIHHIFMDVRTAHKYNIIYGDRWSENILVGPGHNPEFTHIDFDLQYEGPQAREMELSRLSFYLLHAGKEKIRSQIARLLLQDTVLDIDAIRQLMQGHANYFHGTRFSDMHMELEKLFRDMEASVSRCKDSAFSTF